MTWVHSSSSSLSSFYLFRGNVIEDVDSTAIKDSQLSWRSTTSWFHAIPEHGLKNMFKMHPVLLVKCFSGEKKLKSTSPRVLPWFSDPNNGPKCWEKRIRSARNWNSSKWLFEDRTRHLPRNNKRVLQ